MTHLEHELDRTILIRAQRATVFRYFTDPARFAAWWGAGSSIEGRPGGHVRIRYPNGVVATGEVLELEPDRRVVFTYGYEDPGKPIPPGGSRVTITLDDARDGTLLTLRHAFADAGARDQHVPGWRYQLALFANVAADDQHRDAAAVIDRWFEAWAETDGAARREILRSVLAPDAVFRDAVACTRGVDDLDGHVAAAQMHFAGVVMARHGAVRHCQGTALVQWVARGSEGAEKARGTNAFEFAPDGRIARVVGFWDPPQG